MSRFFPYLFLPLLLLGVSSCLDDDSGEFDENYVGSFEACWKTLDEHYCFFDEKGVDWDAMHVKYRMAVDTCKTRYQLLNVLDAMLDELRDGHVNLYAPFNTARYWAWYEDYAPNFDAELVQRYYLGTQYATAAGMSYGVFTKDSVAYLRYPSFEVVPGATNLDYVFANLQVNTLGLIIDVRNNGGGSLTGVPAIAGRFLTRPLCYGYIQHKTGPGHRDFSDPESLTLEMPDRGRVRWDASSRPVVVLTNRHTFSAANNFVQAMRAINGDMTTDTLGHLHPKMVIVMGDKTGGGGGMPFASVLPNGWTLRFSACPITDVDHQSTEAGIDPDISVALDSVAAYEHHDDTMIEAARAYIRSHTRAPRKKEK